MPKAAIEGKYTTTFASPSKNGDEKEKEKNTRKAIVKLFVFTSPQKMASRRVKSCYKGKEFLAGGKRLRKKKSPL